MGIISTTLYSESYFGACLFGAIVAGLAFFIATGLTIAFNYFYGDNGEKQTSVVQLFVDKNGRYKHTIANISTLLLLFVLYILIFVEPTIVWTLRNGAPMLDCDQSTADTGTCGAVTRASLYIIVFTIQAIAWGKFMKWIQIVQVVYILLTAAEFLFLTLFTIYYDAAAKWTVFAFASLFALGAAAIHILSSFASFFSTGKEVDTGGKITQAKKLVWTKEEIEGNSWINKVNYRWGRPEFYVNIIFGLLSKLIYPLLYAIGPHGSVEYNATTEAWVLTGMDVFFIVVLAYFFASLYSFKTDTELVSIGKKIEYAKRNHQLKPLVGNSFLPPMRN